MALTYSPVPELGQSCPDFTLPGLDGRTYAPADFRNGRPLVVMFICNHCPYVKAIEDRLAQLGRDLREKGIPLVAIAANDTRAYPEDSLENLRRRATEKGYVFPYLFDESQAVARAFGAVCTPDFFVYDSAHTLRYRGRLDDSWKDESKVTRRELFEAVLTLDHGAELSPHQPPAMGCSIKWKDEP